MYLITGDVNLDHLVKMLSSRFLHYKVIIYSLIINYLGLRVSWDYVNILFFFNFYQLILASLSRAW